MQLFIILLCESKKNQQKKILEPLTNEQAAVIGEISLNNSYASFERD